jgi:phage tail-like protein
MSFNLELLLSNVPSRYRREDDPTNGGTDFLRRFFSFFGETADEFDQLHKEFFEKIAPATAPEAYIDFWLDRLFDWQFFPRLFTLNQKRTLYANFAQHLARRGTARGIELWMRDFGANVKVWLREDFLGEMYLGEPGYTVSGPLLIVVELISLVDWNSHDQGTINDCFLGESAFVGEPPVRLTPAEIETLLRFMLPTGQQIIVVPRRYEPDGSTYINLDQPSPPGSGGGVGGGEGSEGGGGDTDGFSENFGDDGSYLQNGYVIRPSTPAPNLIPTNEIEA